MMATHALVPATRLPRPRPAMHLATRLAAAAVLSAVTAPGAHAQSARLDTSAGEPRVVVTVTRATRVVPERTSFLAIIEATSESPTEAVQRAQRKVEAVIDAARPFAGRGPAPVAVPYGVSPAANINGFPGSTAQTPYVARYAVRLPTVAVGDAPRLGAAVIAAGASATTPPSFEAVTGSDSVRRSQFADAVAQARRDAEALAAALGGRLGAPVEVTTNAGQNTGRVGNEFIYFARVGFENGPSQFPEVPVTTTVTVRYRLELPAR